MLVPAGSIVLPRCSSNSSIDCSQMRVKACLTPDGLKGSGSHRHARVLHYNGAYGRRSVSSRPFNNIVPSSALGNLTYSKYL